MWHGARSLKFADYVIRGIFQLCTVNCFEDFSCYRKNTHTLQVNYVLSRAPPLDPAPPTWGSIPDPCSVLTFTGAFRTPCCPIYYYAPIVILNTGMAPLPHGPREVRPALTYIKIPGYVAVSATVLVKMPLSQNL